MQIEVLQEFIVVANYLNFRKAAEELHITRPALSKHISSLEERLGFRLFDREGGMRLTPAGEYFYVHVQQVLDSLHDCVVEAADIATKDNPVRVQYTGQESKLFGDLLLSVKIPYLLAKPSTNDPMLFAVENGQADIAVMYLVEEIPELAGEIDGNGLVCVPLGEDQFSLLMSCDNRLAARPKLTREDLRGAEILRIYGKAYEHLVPVIRHVLGEDLDLRVVQNPSFCDVRDVPYCNLGESILFGLRANAAQQCQQSPRLLAFDSLDGEPLAVKSYIVYRADNPNPNVHTFAQEISKLAEREAAGTVEAAGAAGAAETRLTADDGLEAGGPEAKAAGAADPTEARSAMGEPCAAAAV